MSRESDMLNVVSVMILVYILCVAAAAGYLYKQKKSAPAAPLSPTLPESYPMGTTSEDVKIAFKRRQGGDALRFGRDDRHARRRRLPARRPRRRPTRDF